MARLTFQKGAVNRTTGVVTLIALLVGTPVVARATLIPAKPDLTGIVKDQNWAVVLGKALFWEQQVGSDRMACASCHFSAGADSRIRNAWTPGFLKLPAEDKAFGAVAVFDGEPLPGAKVGTTGSGAYPDSAYELYQADFPHLSPRRLQQQELRDPARH